MIFHGGDYGGGKVGSSTREEAAEQAHGRRPERRLGQSSDVGLATHGGMVRSAWIKVGSAVSYREVAFIRCS